MSGHDSSGVASWGLSRRQVLFTIAGTGVIGGCMRPRLPGPQVSLPAQPQNEWPTIHVAYTKPKGKYWLGWPGTAWDVEGFMAQSRRQVEQFGNKLEVRLCFEPKPLHDEADVDRFIAKVRETQPEGVLIFPLHMDRWKLIDEIAQSGVPTVVFAPLGVCFTGHIAAVSKRPGVYLASCADFELNPVRFGMKMIRTAHDVRRTKIAVLRGNETKEQKLEPFGLTIRHLPRRRFPEAFETIEQTPEVVAVAEAYRRAARKIVEPTGEDLINASKNYFASLKIMKDEGCQGITMDCLGLVRDREVPCPPCVAWSKLLDVGIPAVCEADINAVMSHTLCCRLLDKPGFQQDPVPNTVNNTLIGAHCVSATRLNGYDKPREPFNLRSHSESDLGVAVQVLWRIGQEVTIMQFTSPGTMILGKGKVLRNLDTPPAGGCRTSVELEIDGPPDTRDTKGFHQLFIYGDHMRDFQAYGQMYGIETEHI